MNIVRNSQLCQSLDESLRNGELGIESACSLIKAIIKEQCWVKRTIRTGEVVTCDSFRQMLTDPPLRGFGEKPERVAQMLSHDPEALVMFREAMEGKPGRPPNGEPKTDDNVNRIPKGNSKSYTLSRLKSQAPELFKRVVAGELSANAAAIQAGFRKVKTPLEQLKHWWNKEHLPR